MGSWVRLAARSCEDHVRHPVVPGCPCQARPEPRAGGQSRAAARIWHRIAGRTWSPGRDQSWDLFPGQAARRLVRHRDPARFGRRIAGRNPDRRNGAAACPRRPPEPVSQAAQRAVHRTPNRCPLPSRCLVPATGLDQIPVDRQPRNQAYRADRHPGPGARRYLEHRADRRRSHGAGRRPQPRVSRNPEHRASRHQSPGAGRYLGPGPGPRRDPGAGRGLPADPGADRGMGSAVGPSRRPAPDRPRPPCVRRRQGAGHHRHRPRRRGVGHRGAGRRCGVGLGPGGGPHARAADTEHQDRPRGLPGQDPDRCWWRAGASAGPEGAPNRCRSCSPLQSPDTSPLPPRPSGSHSIMKHRHRPRPPFRPGRSPALRAGKAVHPPA